MSVRIYRNLLLALLVPVSAGAITLRSAHAQQLDVEANVQAGGGAQSGDVEALLRGPIHEAFAEPVDYNPQPGLVVPKAPPELVPEMPPEVKPSADAIWLAGYWAWDDERDDYIWISGVYRIPPPNQRWVPGYWQETDGGFQWISGFWVATDSREVEYLPQPPESLEQGPSSPAPSNEYFWVPGYWNYTNNDYAWRAGYWSRGRNNWLWVPHHYAWTPSGHVFLRGYWDYPLVRRGMAFAPVYFRNPVYTRPGYYYDNYRVLDLSRLLVHLFVRPNYGHYYFGDWYGRPYSSRGYYASYAYAGRHGYDPLWTYNNWYYGTRGVNYADRIIGWHRYFERHEDRRPPRTWSDQLRYIDRYRDSDFLSQATLADNLRDFQRRAEWRDRLERVSDVERQRMSRDARDLRQQIVETRRELERTQQAAADSAEALERQRARLRLPQAVDGRDAIVRRPRGGEGRPSQTATETPRDRDRMIRPQGEDARDLEQQRQARERARTQDQRRDQSEDLARPQDQQRDAVQDRQRTEDRRREILDQQRERAQDRARKPDQQREGAQQRARTPDQNRARDAEQRRQPGQNPAADRDPQREQTQDRIRAQDQNRARRAVDQQQRNRADQAPSRTRSGEGMTREGTRQRTDGSTAPRGAGGAGSNVGPRDIGPPAGRQGSVNRDQGNLNRGPGNVNRGPDNVNRGQRNANQGPGNVNRSPGNVNRGPGNVNRNPGSASRGPGNANRGQGNERRGDGNRGGGGGRGKNDD